MKKRRRLVIFQAASDIMSSIYPCVLPLVADVVIMIPQVLLSRDTLHFRSILMSDVFDRSGNLLRLPSQYEINSNVMLW